MRRVVRQAKLQACQAPQQLGGVTDRPAARLSFAFLESLTLAAAPSSECTLPASLQWALLLLTVRWQPGQALSSCAPGGCAGCSARARSGRAAPSPLPPVPPTSNPFRPFQISLLSHFHRPLAADTRQAASRLLRKPSPSLAAAPSPPIGGTAAFSPWLMYWQPRWRPGRAA